MPLKTHLAGLSTCYCASGVAEEERCALTHTGFGVSDSIIIHRAAVMCKFMFLSMSFGETTRYVLSPTPGLNPPPAVRVIDFDGPQLMNLSFHNM